MDDNKLSKIKKRYSNDIGFFVIIDYKISGNILFAKGELIDILPDGKLLVRHVNNPLHRWEIDPEGIINYSVRPLRKKGGKV